MKLRLFYLKHILSQDLDSLIYRFLKLQIEKPVRYDWASTCLQDLRKIKFNISFEEKCQLFNTRSQSEKNVKI